MRVKPILWLALAGLVAMAAGCTDSPRGSQSVAERNDITDRFLRSGPTSTGQIPAADGPVYP